MGFAFKDKYLLLITLVVFGIITASICTNFLPSVKEDSKINAEFIYNTWKVEKVYQNGKLVVNSNKYLNLFLQVNRDGTVEWIKKDKRIKLSFTISPNGSQIITDDGFSLEKVETVYELSPQVLRFGMRNVNRNYEYVLTSVDTKSNFF